MKLKNCIKVTVVMLIIAIICSSFPASAAVSYASVKKNPYYHYGIDVSKWNGDLDWAALKEKGIEFAYIRVGMYDSKGGCLDEKFKTNVKQCVENGIEFGVYVYSKVYSHSKAKSCAKWVCKQLESMGNYCSDKDTIQIAYDIEDPKFVNAIKKKKITRSYLNNSVLKFTDTVKKKGYVPVVYSYETFFTDCLELNELQSRGNRIWYARWPKASGLDVTKKKKMPNDTYADVWQYSSSFYINGVNLDTNVCYEDFYDYKKENSKLTVSGLKEAYSYSLKGVEPNISVYSKDKLLKKDTDYKLAYFSSKSCGEARIKIIRYDNGKYIETKTVKYIIKPGEVENLRAASNENSITLNWNKYSGATSYRVYKYNEAEDEYELLDKTTEEKITVGKLDRGSEYYFKVAAVSKINGKNYIGKTNIISEYTKLKKTTLNSVVSNKNNKAKLKWTLNNSEADGYEIKYSTKRDFSGKKIISVPGNKVSYTVGKLKTGTKYYFRVRQYRIIDNERIYGTYSNLKTVTIK